MRTDYADPVVNARFCCKMAQENFSNIYSALTFGHYEWIMIFLIEIEKWIDLIEKSLKNKSGDKK